MYQKIWLDCKSELSFFIKIKILVELYCLD